MEKREQMILEALLGLILIILLVIMITLFTLPKNQTTSSTIITNSFNTNNYYNTQTKHYPFYTETQKDYLDYDYHAYKRIVKGVLGNDVEHYTVYVKNQDYKPGYFRVNYYFTDYYGNTKTETMTYYIQPKQGKEFIYKNIYKDKYKFYNWDYKVISKTLV